MNRKLLILDLDETLIHGTERELGRSDDFRVDEYFVYKRPYVDEFLDFTKEHFDVAIWSSASEAYLAAVCARLIPQGFPLAFLWGRKRCIRKFSEEESSYSFIKDLKKVKKLGFPLERVIAIDDSARKHQRNHGNLVRVKPFFGDLDDDELSLLMRYLPILAQEDNVRTVEKRGWRAEPSKGKS